MKKIFIVLMAIISFNGFGQDSILPTPTRTQLFSLSPISKKVKNVNGLAFGVGHVDNKRTASQTINGINLEANPAPIAGAGMAFLALVHLPDVIKAKMGRDTSFDSLRIRAWTKTPHLKINGLNVSTGCFFTTTSMNGFNISAGNKFKDFNGLSIAPLGTLADRQSGFSIGAINGNNRLIGATVGLYNQSFELKGVHVGIFNQAMTSHGVQIGILNICRGKGFQLGVWNVNEKRSMPFINW